MVLTRQEERVLRSAMWRGNKSNVENIHVTLNGFVVNFKKDVGFESVESQVLLAPCSTKCFTIPYMRNQTDSQIANERIEQIEEELAENEREADREMEEQAIEYLMNEDYDSSDDSDDDPFN
jgi:hypothetical protein